MNILLEAKDLCKSYPGEESDTFTLDRINLSVYEGDFIAIMGPSGSGKSTLLFALSGMDPFDQGQVKFMGKDLSKMKEDQLADMRRKDMGFVFQYPTMLENLDILDNILLPQLEDRQKNIDPLIEEALGLMKRLGLKGLEERSIKEVSGGQLQRASICRAILHKPKILFGDEPTGSLNSQATEDTLELFQDLNREGTTIVLVTHDPNVAARAKRLVFLKDGKIEKQVQFKEEDLEQRQKLLRDQMLLLGI